MLFALALLGAQATGDTELSRVFTQGQVLTYSAKSHILSEVKAGDMAFFMPHEEDVNYKFTMTIEEAKPSGFATVLYERPTMLHIMGETADSPPRETVLKSNLKLRLSLSPINEITDMKNLSEKKKDDKKTGLFARVPFATSAAQDSFILSSIDELRSLAMFLGSIDSNLDFAPKLPLDEVAVGSTWKRTVSYQPRELKGTKKQAVQRLDYVYKFEGPVESDGKKVLRVTGTLDLETDTAKFMHQMMASNPDETGIKSIDLKLKTNISFDLDEKTKTTLKIVAGSKGSFGIHVTDRDDTVYEEKLTGSSNIQLVSIK